MGKYKVKFSKNAVKDYKKLPKDYKVLIDSALFRLAEGAWGDVKSVQGENDVYRLRVGKYRVLFTLVDGTVLVVRIRTRGNVYK